MPGRVFLGHERYFYAEKHRDDVGLEYQRKVDVQAFDMNGNMIHEKVVTITDSAATLVKFNWDDVASVTFTPGKSMQDPNLQGGGGQIVFDDVKITNQTGQMPMSNDAVGTATHNHSFASAGSMLGFHDLSSHLMPANTALF